jgi:hypothetical protein
VSEVAKTDEWKEWVKVDNMLDKPYVNFPVFLYPSDTWMVYKPGTQDYMIVPNDEYLENRKMEK